MRVSSPLAVLLSVLSVGLSLHDVPAQSVDINIDFIRGVISGYEIQKDLREMFDKLEVASKAAGGRPLKVEEARLAALDTKRESIKDRRPPEAPPFPQDVSTADPAGRAAALRQLEQYSASREEQIRRLQQERSDVAAELQTWAEREDRARRITDRLGKLMEDPAVTTVFKEDIGWTWYDYTAEVIPRVGDIVNEFGALLKRYDAAIQTETARQKDLSANLSLLRDALKSAPDSRETKKTSVCDLSGSWVTQSGTTRTGQLSIPGPTMRLQSEGSRITGQYTGGPIGFPSTSIAGETRNDGTVALVITYRHFGGGVTATSNEMLRPNESCSRLEGTWELTGAGANGGKIVRVKR